MTQNTLCPKIGLAQWTCTGAECTCHLKERVLAREKKMKRRTRQSDEDDTQFHFGWTPLPGMICKFCGATNGMFCLSLKAAALCLEDAKVPAWS
jgi:hypothetical protein